MSYFVRRNSVDPAHDLAGMEEPIPTSSRLPAKGVRASALPLRDPSLRALSQALKGPHVRRDYARVWPELLCMWR